MATSQMVNIDVNPVKNRWILFENEYLKDGNRGETSDYHGTSFVCYKSPRLMLCD